MPTDHEYLLWTLLYPRNSVCVCEATENLGLIYKTAAVTLTPVFLKHRPTSESPGGHAETYLCALQYGMSQRKPEDLHSSEFPGDADAAGPGTTLRTADRCSSHHLVPEMGSWLAHLDKDSWRNHTRGFSFWLHSGPSCADPSSMLCALEGGPVPALSQCPEHLLRA